MPDIDIENETSISDADIFAGVMADEKHDSVQEERHTPRDERGRFAAREPDDEPEQHTEAVNVTPHEPENQVADKVEHTDRDGMVPSWRLREIREAREAARREADQRAVELEEARRQIAAMQHQMSQINQKPVEVPDPIVDPTGYQTHFSNALDSRMREMEANFSFRLAHTVHKDGFEKAYADMVRRANAGDSSVVRQVMASPDPGESLMRWYKREQTIATVGDDPDAYRAKVLEEALNDEAYLAKAVERIKARGNQSQGIGSSPRNVTKLPPSLSRATGTAVDAIGSDDDMSDKALLSSMLRR